MTNPKWCKDDAGRKKIYLCTMKQKSSGLNRDFIISFFLPEEMTGWIEVVNIMEEPNTGKTRADTLYGCIPNIYLDKRDNREGEQLGLKPNGFTEATIIKDYPIRNRKVLLHVRRRRYLDADGKNIILSNKACSLREIKSARDCIKAKKEEVLSIGDFVCEAVQSIC